MADLQPAVRTSFQDEITKNKRRTVVMLAAFVLLVALVGVALDFLVGGGGVIAGIAFLVALGMAWFSYFKSDAVALRVSGAIPADPIEYRRYHNLVEGLCIASGLPKPRLYVIVDPAPNAFATGRDPKHAALAVTTGLLERMNRVELEGVLAHELSHVKNYDMLVSTVAVVAVGTIALVSDIGLRMMFWGGGRSRRDDDRNGGGPAGAILAVLALALLVLAPLVAMLMQFSMSRKRELLADASAVALTRYPPGLASALRKLRDDTAVVRTASRATAQLWIESPLERVSDTRGSRLNRAYDTHPPLEERIRILESM